MQRHGLAHQKLGPNLVTGDIGGQELGATGAKGLALRDDGRHQDGAGVAIERDIVVVQYVGGRAIDESRILDVSSLERRNERGEGAAVGAGHFPIDECDHRILRAGDHHAETIGDPRLGDRLGLGRDVLQGEAGHEMSEFGGERGHDWSPCVAGTISLPITLGEHQYNAD
jgi:hypothetical protein